MGLRRRTLLAGGLGLAAQACSPSGKNAADAPIRFSILSTENAAAQGVKWLPFLHDIGQMIGREVKPTFAIAYTPLIEAMRFGQSDLGWFSNQPGLMAVRTAGGEVFARTTHPDGDRGYKSIILVRKGSGLTLDKLLKCDKTLSFGMGDAKSTSGTLAPKAWLFEPRGIEPQECFKTVRSASHEANLMAVANGVIDAATNNTNDMERQHRRADDAIGKALNRLEVVWSSPPLPEDPMVWRKALDPELKAKLKAAILGYGVGTGAEAERQRQVLTTLNFGAFKPATDDHLLRVREMEAVLARAEARKKGDATALAAAQTELDTVQARMKLVGPEV
jgi:phosphonate transport system substrate-binding protein